MKKILITSVSAGAGHVRAASAVEQYLKDDFIVKNVDLMSFSKTWFKSIYADHYLDIIYHAPKLWKLLYKLSDKPTNKTNYATRAWVEYKSHKKFFKELEEFNPDIVLSTHFMPPEILARHKRKTGATYKVAVVVTDF